MKGSGQPLPKSIRNYFEPRFGRDFSQVRVHCDSKAAKIAKSMSARAFTTGSDVMFGEGQYSPNTLTGKRLLAHELTHAIQQTGFRDNEVAMGIQRVADDRESGSDLDSELFRGDPLLEVVHDGLDLISKHNHSRGEPVRKLQLGLLRLNPVALPVYGADGIFGSETEAAIKKFQGDSGLDIDGIVGKLTLGQLDDRLASHPTEGIHPTAESHLPTPGKETSVAPWLEREKRCACDCQSYDREVASRYALDHVIPTMEVNPDPKNLRIIRWGDDCMYHASPCTWTSWVLCEYRGRRFTVIVQLMSGRLFNVFAPEIFNLYPTCSYDFKCVDGFRLRLTQLHCFYSRY